VKLEVTGKMLIGISLVFLAGTGSGLLLSRIVLDPPSVNHPSGLCFQVDPRSIPPPWNGYIPAQYLNGSFTGWVCKK
jgi:hypothetical protein